MKFARIGVVGLGHLGGTIAKVLTGDGEVHGCDLDPARCALAAENGITIEASPAAVAAVSDVVVLSLPESEAVAEVCCGRDGIASSGRRGLLVIDTTSGYPAGTLETAAGLQAAGMRMIEATITGPEGGIVGALKRDLTLMVGGDPVDVAEARPLLERLASHVVEVGPLSCGQIVKMVNNMCSAVALVATVEGMLVAAKHGIAPEVVAEAMLHGTGSNFQVRHLGMLREPPVENNVFALGLMTKDLRHMSRFARESGVPTILADTVFHLYELFTARLGYGVNLLRLREAMEEWAGVELPFSGAADRGAPVLR
jgi:3-hydroxyisobutyrate dehydrogenase